MSFQGKLKQYLLITEGLNRKPNQTLSQLQEMLINDGFNISSRTIQRNIESLRVEFGVEIECNRSFYEYSINKELSVDIDFFLQFLHTAIHAQFVAENIKDFKNITNYIHFSDKADLKGLQLLQPLLESIKVKNVISFNHENYVTEEHKFFVMEPYMLKEYLNRWYVVGFVPAINEFRTIGVDRINDLKITGKKFKRKQTINPKSFFENTIGLVYSEYPIQEVIIQASEQQAKYIRSQLLHSSQVELKNFQFKLTLTPNYELIQRILMLGSEVSVIEPEWLRSEIRGILEDSLKNYRTL